MAGLLPAGPEEESLGEVTAELAELLVNNTELGQWQDFYLRVLRKSD